MQAAREIRRAQEAWALTKNIPCNSQGYVRDVESNLLRPLSPSARGGFEKGAGSEMAGNMSWTFRISSGVNQGIYKSVVQSDWEFLRIGVGGGQ